MGVATEAEAEGRVRGPEHVLFGPGGQAAGLEAGKHTRLRSQGSVCGRREGLRCGACSDCPVPSAWVGALAWASLFQAILPPGGTGKARTAPRSLEPIQERHGGGSWGLPGCSPLNLGYFGS